ncbi:hypothetical protein KHQ88_00140 [Mycoplasmatota bacterium]|nr:hypothetical protein KHQ88_00140 [Mycoplasmatota bacterium]
MNKNQSFILSSSWLLLSNKDRKKILKDLCEKKRLLINKLLMEGER